MTGKTQPTFTLRRQQRQILRLILAMLIGMGITLEGGGKIANIWGYPGLESVFAQTLRTENVAILVYQSLPYLPKENQYLRQENGEIAPDNTLISRLIRYHEDVKKRPTRFRLDWKLTLADYLGANEPINPERYPGSSTLKTNPAENDIKIIRSLTRRQRQELVDILASIYNPKTEDSSSPNNSPQSQPNPSPKPVSKPTKPSLSKPGDAQLLKLSQ